MMSNLLNQYSKDSLLSLMNVCKTIKLISSKLSHELNEELKTFIIQKLPFFENYVSYWINYLNESVEENIEQADRNLIQNISELIKEIHLHLNHIMLLIEEDSLSISASKSIQRNFIINNPKLLHICMEIDFRNDKITSDFIIKNYHHSIRKRSTSIFPDEEKSLLRNLHFKDEKCKIVYLRSNRPTKQVKKQSCLESNTLEIGIVYLKKQLAESNDISVHHMIHMDTGNSLTEMQKQFSSIFYDYISKYKELEEKKQDTKFKVVGGDNYKKFKKVLSKLDKRLEALKESISEEVLSHFRLLLSGDFKNPEINAFILDKVCEIIDVIVKQLSKHKMSSNFIENEVNILKLMLSSVISSYIVAQEEPDQSKFKYMIQAYLNMFKIWKLCGSELLISNIVDMVHKCREEVLNKYNKSDLKRCITYLMIQPELANFPFESLNIDIDLESGVMSGAEQYFMRIPSIDLISHYLENSKKYPEIKSLNKWYFLVNPQGDCKRTEERMKGFCSENKTWNGIFGKKPSSEEQFYIDLKKSEMLLYCGHGVGLDIYAPLRLSRNKIKSGCLMIGCSSASNKYNGLMEMSNYYNYFFISGCPFFAGCLWDVIDKDIDCFTLNFMKTWFLESENMMSKVRSKLEYNEKDKTKNSKNIDIEHIIVRSRQIALKTCEFKNFSGSSLAFYGMPLILFNLIARNDGTCNRLASKLYRVTQLKWITFLAALGLGVFEHFDILWNAYNTI